MLQDPRQRQMERERVNCCRSRSCSVRHSIGQGLPQRTRLANRLAADDCALVAELAGIGPRMLERKTTMVFLQDCTEAIRTGNPDVDVDVDELSTILEHVLQDATLRVPLVKALGNAAKATQQQMLARHGGPAVAEMPVTAAAESVDGGGGEF